MPRVADDPGGAAERLPAAAQSREGTDLGKALTDGFVRELQT